MAKLKLGAIADDKPIKLTVELPAAVHRDLLAYAEVLAWETGQPISDPSKLIAPMLARFIATDRAFWRARSYESNLGRRIALSQKWMTAVGHQNPASSDAPMLAFVTTGGHLARWQWILIPPYGGSNPPARARHSAFQRISFFG
jgi:hypothetical protein